MAAQPNNDDAALRAEYAPAMLMTASKGSSGEAEVALNQAAAPRATAPQAATELSAANVLVIGHAEPAPAQEAVPSAADSMTTEALLEDRRNLLSLNQRLRAEIRRASELLDSVLGRHAHSCPAQAPAARLKHHRMPSPEARTGPLSAATSTRPRSRTPAPRGAAASQVADSRVCSLERTIDLQRKEIARLEKQLACHSQAHVLSLESKVAEQKERIAVLEAEVQTLQTVSRMQQRDVDEMRQLLDLARSAPSVLQVPRREPLRSPKAAAAAAQAPVKG
jgi:hypothetical protein